MEEENTEIIRTLIRHKMQINWTSESGKELLLVDQW